MLTPVWPSWVAPAVPEATSNLAGWWPWSESWVWRIGWSSFRPAPTSCSPSSTGWPISAWCPAVPSLSAWWLSKPPLVALRWWPRMWAVCAPWSITAAPDFWWKTRHPRRSPPGFVRSWPIRCWQSGWGPVRCCGPGATRGLGPPPCCGTSMKTSPSGGWSSARDAGSSARDARPMTAGVGGRSQCAGGRRSPKGWGPGYRGSPLVLEDARRREGLRDGVAHASPADPASRSAIYARPRNQRGGHLEVPPEEERRPAGHELRPGPRGSHLSDGSGPGGTGRRRGARSGDGSVVGLYRRVLPDGDDPGLRGHVPSPATVGAELS